MDCADLFDASALCFKEHDLWTDRQDLIRKFVVLNGLPMALWCAWPVVKTMIG